MGNGQVKGWPPTGVVTIVLAGGRIEEFKRPILAGDIMLRHPRHHVVRPDFFRSSPVVVLKPEEVLLPGHKFFLVPFHTVHKKLSKMVDVLRSSTSSTTTSATSSAASVAAGAYPKACGHHQGEIKDITNRSRHRSVCKQCSVPCAVRITKKDLAGVMNSATRSPVRSSARSPAGRASGLRKSSPSTGLQARKTNLHKEVSSRHSRKRLAGDIGDYARRRTSLQSRMRRDNSGGVPAAEFTEIEAFDASDFSELQSFRSAEFAVGFDSIELLVAKLAAPSPTPSPAPWRSELSIPEYESFQTSLKSSGELSFQPQPAISEAVSEIAELESFEFEAMDFCEAEKMSIEPLLPTPATLVKKLVQSFEPMDSTTLLERDSRSQTISPKTPPSVEERKLSFDAMDCSSPKKNSRAQPTSPSSAPSVEMRESVEAMDCLSPEKKPSSPISLKAIRKSVEEQKSVEAMGFSSLEKISRSLTSPKTVRKSVEAVDSSTSLEKKNSRWSKSPILIALSLNEDESFEAMDSSEQEKIWIQPPVRMPSPFLAGYASFLSMKERLDSLGCDSGLDHQRRNAYASEGMESRGRGFGLGQQTRDGSHASVQAGMKERMDNRGGDFGLDHQKRDGYASVFGMKEIMKERMDSRGGDSGLDYQRRDGYASPVFGMKENMNVRVDSRGGDSGGVEHQNGKEDPLGFNKPPRSASSVQTELKQKRLTIKMACLADAQQATSHSTGRQNGSRLYQPTSREKQSIEQKEAQQQQQQQSEMEDQTGGLKGTQQVPKGAAAENTKSEVKVSNSGPLFKSCISKPMTPARTPGRSVKKPPINLVKQRKPYRQKLIERLCFSSSLQSPLHVQAVSGRTHEKTIKRKLKLIDHLNKEPSPPPRYVQKLYQHSPLHAHATKMNSPLRPHRQLPIPPQNGSGGSRRVVDPKAQKDPIQVAVQVNQPVKTQPDPSVLSATSNGPNDVQGKASIEEKFLKVPPLGFFRHRKIRTRKRVHTFASWKPKLSPLVEI
ncbi:unnamed protein product [Calypogeia fissa]